MGPLSPATTVAALVLALAAPALTGLFWSRSGRSRFVRFAVRGALLLTTQLLAVVAVAVVINDDYRFYGSWGDLFGTAGRNSSVAAGTGFRLSAAESRRLTADYHSGHGTVLPWTIDTGAGGLPATTSGLVYLPAEYGNPAARAERFPVVELFSGFPGTPATWFGPLHLSQILDGLIASHEVQPFVALLPPQNLFYPRDTECVNVVHGPQMEDYLTAGVRRTAIADFRVQPQRSAWGLIGVSLGGYCAMNLAMHHPDLYRAAVSLSGDTAAAHDGWTRSLFGGSRVLAAVNSVLWQSQHWPTSSPLPGGPLDVLAVAGRDDHGVYAETRRIAGVRRGSLHISAFLVDHGAHNARLWTSLEPFAFNWLSQRLDAPLVDLVPVGGRVITSPTPSASPSPSAVPVAHPRRTTPVGRHRPVVTARAALRGTGTTTPARTG